MKAPLCRSCRELPPMPAVRRIAELFEALFNLERDLTGELIAELSRCSAAELRQLFGPARAAMGYGSAPSTCPNEQVKPAAPEEVSAPCDPHASWRWDANGRRILGAQVGRWRPKGARDRHGPGPSLAL